MDATTLLDVLKKQTQDILEFTEAHLSDLPQDQLLKRPDPRRWSILECLEHMNLSSGHYIKSLDKILPKAKNQSFRNDFRPGYFGNYFSEGMLPDDQGKIKNRMKTFYFFEPKLAPVKGMDTLGDFIQMNQKTLELIEACRSVDINKNRVTSTLGPIFRFKAGDALRFAIAHNRRHMLQLKGVYEQVTGTPILRKSA